MVRVSGGHVQVTREDQTHRERGGSGKAEEVHRGLRPGGLKVCILVAFIYIFPHYVYKALSAFFYFSNSSFWHFLGVKHFLRAKMALYSPEHIRSVVVNLGMIKHQQPCETNQNY